MDPRLLKHYNTELQFLREMGGEFASQFPKVAARLGMDGTEVTDPYVERLLEGAAFLNARTQLRLESEFPKFTRRLLEIVYPQLLAPVPSMCVVRFEPDINDGALDKGFPVPRGLGLRSVLGRGESTACEFRTAHDVTLLPLKITQAQYFTYAPDLPLNSLQIREPIRGGLRLRLSTRDGMTLDKLSTDKLCLYLSGSDETAYRLHELIHGAGLGVMGVSTTRPVAWQHFVGADAIKVRGYSDEDALLPATLAGFRGYRLLQEYFNFPQRFLFFELHGLAPILKRCNERELDLIIPLSRGDSGLESLVDHEEFSLFCTPAINLFQRRTDRINVTRSAREFNVVVDRTRPMDFEVHSIQKVTGFEEGSQQERVFLPFYEAYQDAPEDQQAYFTLNREPRLLNSSQQQKGHRSTYIGSEVFLSLVDSMEAPFSENLKQLAVAALCTNRDLPLHMPVGVGKTDFTPARSIPAPTIRCIRGPTRPRSTHQDKQSPWSLISQLSLNYLSLIDSDPAKGAAALREILGLYAGSDTTMVKQVEGLRSISAEPVTRRLPMPGPIAFGRGLEIRMEVNELAFEGSSPFLFGTVMEEFFARYVNLNSFTQTTLIGASRGQIMKWRPRCGSRAIL